jgi:tetratricopeptide (TPR) repeat protein
MNTPTVKNTHWLDIAEIIAVIGSIGGSVTSVFLQQLFWATVPLSASAALALLNHQRLKNIIESEVIKEQQNLTSLVTENKQKLTNSSAILQKQYYNNKTEIAEVADALGQVRNLATTELARLSKEEKTDFVNTSKELKGLQNSLYQLDSLSHKLEKNLEKIDKKQKETSKQLRELRAIDVFSQNIKVELNTVQSYFERGFAYQRLGNKHRAIEDYSKTIELANNHAQAYYNRGLLYAELGINQKAVIDLRKASQIYFKKGNLEKYREARDLSQKIHQQTEVNINQVEESTEKQNNINTQVIVGNLFG